MAGSGSIGGWATHIDEFRKEVNRIHIQLIEFSLLGETALDWDTTDLENYQCPTHCIGQQIVPVQ